jgi:hypothetical protein
MEMQKELDIFFGLISPSLKRKVVEYIFKEVIVVSGIPTKNENVLEFITQKLDLILFLPEDHIINQGEIGTKMYFLARGECQVSVLTERKKK